MSEASLERLKQLSELDKQYFLHPTSSIQQQQAEGPRFIFEEGNGIYLRDITGHTVIDGMSSLWNVNIGHGREELGQVAMKQMSKLAYSSCFSTFSNEPAILLAEKIAQIAPGDLGVTFFTSGGSESNDTVYKLARHYWILKGQPNKKKIISREKSYHGVAMGSTSATGLKPFRDFTNSLAPDFYHVDNFSPKALEELIDSEGPETIAAFVAEPVQGAGGVHVAPKDYFMDVKKICEKYQILFVTDEVITGFGRTGKYFGIEHYGVSPDFMCFAKGITSGYAQLGGVMLSKRIHKEFIELSKDTLLHGYTYSGHPTACAVGMKNIEIIERENLIENARLMGEEMLKGFKWLQNTRKIVGEVSGLGLLGGISILSKQNSRDGVQQSLSPIIVSEAANRGLICRAVTFEGQDRLVFAPPLIINKQEIEKMIEILSDSISAVEKLVLVV